MHCRICESLDDTPEVFHLAERMFISGEVFEYFRCRACGCLQITEAPAEIERFYPPDYYSFRGDSASYPARLKQVVRDYLAINAPKTIFSGQPWWELGDRKALRDASVPRSARILDVGCGAGELVRSMRDIGFTHFVGADPYIESDIVHANGARILKRYIGEIDEQFDLVVLNHSFEHIWDQAAFVESLSKIVRANGKCVIRIPTIDSWAWDHYRTDWVQLDPPRHFYLHSRRSIRLILERHGFTVRRIVDDSTEFQQLGSEIVRAGKPLAGGSVFGRREVTAAWRTARRLNAEGRGDQIAVHCTKA